MVNVIQSTKEVNSLGYIVYEKIRQSKNNESLVIIFTKGKLELELELVERVNCYDECLNIVLKDGEIIFVNLYQVTTIQ